jgi:hypothetical protein
MLGHRGLRAAAIVALGLVAAVAWVATSLADTPPAFLQAVSAHRLNVSSLTLTPASNVTAGNRLIVETGVWNSSGATAASVTDSAGNKYTELLHFVAGDATELSVWSAPITAGGGTRPTITVRPTSTADAGAVVLEYSGLSTASDATAVDVMSHASGTTSGAASVASGPTAPTNGSNELSLGLYVDSGFGDTLSSGPGYTSRVNVSKTPDMELLAEDSIVSAAGATTNATAGTGANTTWLMADIVFKSGTPAPPTAPAAPTNVNATAGDSSAAISWTAPANGGSPITSYTVTPYIGSSAQGSTTITGSPPTTSATITGLTNGTAYAFTVTASNAIGTGLPSPRSNSVTPGPPSAGPAIDASTPAINSVAPNVTAIPSNPFSPPGGTVVYVAFAVDSDPSITNPHVSSVSNSGAPLTWHLKGAESHTGPGVGGYVEAWWAYNPTAQTNITVTGNLAQPTKNVTPPIGAVQVTVFRGAAQDQTSAASAANYDSGSGSVPTATVTTTAPNSLVFGVANNWDSSVTPTVPPGQTTTINGLSSVILNPTDQDTYWVQAMTAPTATPGPVTINDTAPSVRFHELAWEVTAATPSTQPGGQWGSLMNWPMVAIHSILMNNGNVLQFDGWQQPEPTQVWNPSTNTFTTQTAPDSIFCSGMVQLPDGRVLVVGGFGGLSTGQQGIVDTTIFDPATSTWSRVADMHYPRWYPDLTELADGRYVAISGNSTSPSTWADTPEVYIPSSNTWTVLSNVNTSQIHDEEYPFSYLAPNGNVFTIGPGEDKSFFLNVQNQTWNQVGGSSGVLNGSSVMYRPGKVLYSGGTNAQTSSSPANATAAMIDLTAPTPAWQQIAPMNSARVYHTLTMLADGTVLAVGGEPTWGQTGTTETTGGVLPSEIWNPSTGTWSVAASTGVTRGYHSTAVLMPDGTVLVAGSGHANPGYPGQSSAQSYSPPYLFKGARPTISSAPAATTYGATIPVSTPDAASISAVNLVSLGSDTHQADMSQHFVPLSFTQGSGTLNVQIPSNAAIAPPGNYMLFIVNSAGVPSVAPFIRVIASPPTAPSAPSAVSALAGNAAATVSWTAPGDGGSPITGYTVTPYVGSTAQAPTTVSGSPPATSATINGLANGTTYTFTVSATNAVGTGPPSAPSTAVTPGATHSPTFVQSASAHRLNVSSAAITPTSNVTVGNRLIVETGVWNSSGATVAGVTDSAGNNYIELLHYKASDGTEQSVWTAPITAGGATRPTITVRPTSTADVGAAVLEYSGVSTVGDATVVDQMAHTSGTTGGAATVASGATPATTAGNELALGLYVDSGFGDALSSGTGYTSRVNVSNTPDMELLVEDQLLPSAGATPNASAGTGSGTTWLMATIVLKAASGGLAAADRGGATRTAASRATYGRPSTARRLATHGRPSTTRPPARQRAGAHGSPRCGSHTAADRTLACRSFRHAAAVAAADRARFVYYALLRHLGNKFFCLHGGSLLSSTWTKWWFRS